MFFLVHNEVYNLVVDIVMVYCNMFAFNACWVTASSCFLLALHSAVFSKY